MSTYTAGRNIAMKIPLRDYDAVVRFYTETLGFPVIDADESCTVVEFGHVRLNLDRVPHQSQTDVWFQVQTKDVSAAKRELEDDGVTMCDEVEPLPDGYDGFWITAPNGVIHLIDAAQGRT